MAFITSQATTVFSPSINNEEDAAPGVSRTDSLAGGAASEVSSFRKAMFFMALRLEVVNAIMKQRRVDLPLDAWASLRSFEEAEDTVWTHRLILHCADVAQFCFGGEISTGKTQMERWNELQKFEDLWEASEITSFLPIRHQEPDQNQNHCLPVIWYMSECHALGMQYLDLARILLTVYDPSIPRLGCDSVLSARRISATVRGLVLKICGTAKSNQTMLPALIIAHLAITACGQYFTDENEPKMHG
jgi:hypothetical protein